MSKTRLPVEAYRDLVTRALAEDVGTGVTLGRLPEIASTGADFVSVGALTHSVRGRHQLRARAALTRP